MVYHSMKQKNRISLINNINLCPFGSIVFNLPNLKNIDLKDIKPINTDSIIMLCVQLKHVMSKNGSGVFLNLSEPDVSEDVLTEPNYWVDLPIKSDSLDNNTIKELINKLGQKVLHMAIQAISCKISPFSEIISRPEYYEKPLWCCIPDAILQTNFGIVASKLIPQAEISTDQIEFSRSVLHKRNTNIIYSLSQICEMWAESTYRNIDQPNIYTWTYNYQSTVKKWVKC